MTIVKVVFYCVDCHQPDEAPGVGPEVLLIGTSDAALQSDSDGDLHSEPGSPVNDNFPRQSFHQR